jgi:hypothetical protein
MIASGKAEKKAARAARLSAALRENLKRRKAQTRGRSQSHDSNEVTANEVRADEAPSGEKPAGAAKAPDFRRNRGRD